MQIGLILTPQYVETVYVYVLFASDDRTVRCVGKTADPAVRYRTLAGYREGRRPEAIGQWVDSVRARGAVLHMQIIAACSTDKEACEIEWAWIQRAPGLLNAKVRPNYCPRGRRVDLPPKPKAPKPPREHGHAHKPGSVMAQIAERRQTDYAAARAAYEKDLAEYEIKLQEITQHAS